MLHHKFKVDGLPRAAMADLKGDPLNPLYLCSFTRADQNAKLFYQSVMKREREWQRQRGRGTAQRDREGEGEGEGRAVETGREGDGERTGRESGKERERRG